MIYLMTESVIHNSSELNLSDSNNYYFLGWFLYGKLEEIR